MPTCRLWSARRQGGVRPVLIVQNEIGNRHSPHRDRGGHYIPAG